MVQLTLLRTQRRAPGLVRAGPARIVDAGVIRSFEDAEPVGKAGGAGAAALGEEGVGIARDVAARFSVGEVTCIGGQREVC